MAIARHSPDSDRREPGPRLPSSWRLLLMLLVVAAGLVIAGAVLGSRLDDYQASAELDTAASNMTDVVRAEKLEHRLSARARLRPVRQTALGAPAVARPVVSYLPIKHRQLVRNGDMLVEVAGRPVIMLAGDFPAWRDFVPGMPAGRDVRQLAVALNRAGLLRTLATANYDARVQSAVERLYRRAGYSPPASAGVLMPMSEVAFIPGGDGIVDTLAVRVGDILTDNAIVIGSLKRRVEVELSNDQSIKIAIGQTLKYTGDSGSQFIGKVAGVSSQLAADDSTSDVVAIELADALSPSIESDGVAEIVVAQTRDAVVSVPVSALFLSEGGGFYVVLEQNPSQRIPVTTGLTTDTRVEVKNADPRLRPGAVLSLNPHP